MKALIVDDELDTVDYLVHHFNWKLHGIDYVEKAYSAREAMKLVSEQVPDIILCDIEMPQMSGLDFLEWLREMKFPCEFIFLTCHERFEYATKAMQFNAKYYLTKPINTDEIANAITACIQTINANNYLKQCSVHGRYWMKNQAVLYHNFWQGILFGYTNQNMNMDQMQRDNDSLQIDRKDSWYLVVTGISKSEILEFEWNDSSFYFAFKKLAMEIITEQLEYRHVVEYLEGSFLYFFILLKKSENTVEGIKNRSQSFVNKCNEYLMYNTNCWISTPVPINKLYEQKEQVLRLYVGNQNKEQKIFYMEDIVACEVNTFSELDYQMLRDSLEKSDRMSAINTVKNVFITLSEDDQLNRSNIIIVHQAFLQILYAYLQNHEIMAKEMFADETAQYLYMNAEKSIFDMLKWVDYSVDTAIKYVALSKNADPIIQTVKDYIKHHYHENIRRSNLANVVFLTPNYLSKLFNEKTGQSLTEYMNECRISAAKIKLCDKENSISDIALDCGFDNISYFSTIFKKLVGVTPNEYRNLNGAK